VSGAGGFSLVLALILAVPGAARAEEAAGAARVLGTVRVTGDVEAKRADAEWRTVSGGPVLEGTALRTGEGGAAVVKLAAGDVLGLAERSSLEFGSAPRVRLVSGRLALRLPASSGLEVDTPHGLVRVPAVAGATGDETREGLVAVEGETTTLHVYRGVLDAVPSGGRPAPVGAGAVATLGPGTRVDVTPAPGGGAATAAKTGLVAGLGLSPLGALFVTTGVAVAGGLGAAAATGAFSNEDGGGSAPAGGNQGSPFRPVVP
jgi:hypothetical protein